MLAPSMPQTALVSNATQQKVFNSPQTGVRPARHAFQRVSCRRHAWRIQAFGGLFGGGKKDAAGTKVALMVSDAQDGSRESLTVFGVDTAVSAVPGQAMQEMQEHRLRHMPWLQGEQADWLSCKLFNPGLQSFFLVAFSMQRD